MSSNIGNLGLSNPTKDVSFSIKGVGGEPTLIVKINQSGLDSKNYYRIFNGTSSSGTLLKQSASKDSEETFSIPVSSIGGSIFIDASASSSGGTSFEVTDATNATYKATWDDATITVTDKTKDASANVYINFDY